MLHVCKTQLLNSLKIVEINFCIENFSLVNRQEVLICITCLLCVLLTHTKYSNIVVSF